MLRRDLVSLLLLSMMMTACGDDSESADPGGSDANDVGAADIAQDEGPAETAGDTPALSDLLDPDGVQDAVPAVGPLEVGELEIVEPGGDTVCSRGTPFRYFALGGDPEKIILDFDGGGACWNAATCSVAEAIFSPEAPSAEQIEGWFDTGYSPGLYDLDNPKNPFAGWTLVHIPYCTGDIHWGNNVVDYTDDLQIHHKGFVNFTAVMQWVTERYTAPSHVLVTGCSAGAYGAIGASPHIQQLWPEAKLTVLADSGAGIITETFFQDSFPQWQADAAVPWWLPEFEGKTIDDLDIVSLYSGIVNGLPSMRVAQYNTAFDADQTFYFDVMGGEQEDWNPKLVTTLDAISAAAPAFRHYTAPGPIHCIHPYDIFYDREVGGTSYADWLYELAHGEDLPDTVKCEDAACLDDAICDACLDGSSTDPGCGWCSGWGE